MVFAYSDERKPTNVRSIYFCGAFILILLSLVAYSSFTGDVRRITKGTDDCGYICGIDNAFNGASLCKQSDKRQLPFLKVDIIENQHYSEDPDFVSECVRNCTDYNGYKEFGNRCFKIGAKSDFAGIDTLFADIAEDLVHFSPQIVMSCGVAVVFSYVLLILFRYAAKCVIWIVLIALLLSLGTVFVASLVNYVQASSSHDTEVSDLAGFYLTLTIIFGILTLIEAIFLCLLRNRIRLVSQLFKETSKVLIELPLTMFEPVLSFIALALTSFTTVYFAMIIGSSGDFKIQHEEQKTKAVFEHNVASTVAHYINIIAFIWFTSFVIGCQNFVISSTVCQWFFTRSKDKLDSPIKRAFSHLVRFHIGSICLGSILITIVKIIRNIVDNLKNNARNPVARLIGYFCAWIMRYFEQLMKYLARNAYIIVALNGTPLIESGKKALRLLTSNLLDVIALNRFGDFVLFVGKVFVTAISGFICYSLIDGSTPANYTSLPVVVSVIFAFLIASCFLSVFEMAVDTIFICFCEDCEINDGITKPFYMSRELMETMQELKGAAGGEFSFQKLNPGGEAGQPLGVPSEWKFEK